VYHPGQKSPPPCLGGGLLAGYLISDAIQDGQNEAYQEGQQDAQNDDHPASAAAHTPASATETRCLRLPVHRLLHVLRLLVAVRSGFRKVTDHPRRKGTEHLRRKGTEVATEAAMVVILSCW
jgi:hypothetical protein